MGRKYLILTALTAIFVCFLQSGCQNQAGQINMPKPVAPSTNSITTQKQLEVVPEANELSPKITFEKTAYDFGEVGPGAKNVGEFKFTNIGPRLLEITKVESCCGCVTVLSKTQYQPNESGVLKVECNWGQRSDMVIRRIYVNSNDTVRPKVALTLTAKIVPKVDYKPETLSLLLKNENADCPDITLTGLDNKPFSIKGFKSTGDCISADFDSSVEATKFVLKPTVSLEKLQKGISGLVEISITHPQLQKITIPFNALPRFKINPPVIILFEAVPQKPIIRDIWIFNNYGEDFEIESASSKSAFINLLKQQKVANGHRLQVQITPPSAESKQRLFTDIFSVNIKGSDPLTIACRGFYTRDPGPAPNEQ